MFTVIFGVVITLIAFCIKVKAGFACLGITLLLLALPIEGFEKRKLERQLTLLKLKEYSQDIFIIKQKDKVKFAFNNKDEFDIDGIAYEEETVSGNIKIYEDKECETPILKVYVQKPSVGFFSLTPFFVKRQYVFYIPYGSVDYNDKKEK